MEMKANWNEKYDTKEYIFGEKPNEFLKEHLPKLKKGTILFPAEGEGRNALFAAKLGWNVSAFDISEVAEKKAIELFSKNNVQVDYIVADVSELKYAQNHFDAAAFIYAHFAPELKSYYNVKIASFIKSGGTIIFEAFSKNHVKYVMSNPNVGGPTREITLFSKEEILNDFSDFVVLYLEEEIIDLKEGFKHDGEGSVIRFIGKKK